MKKAWVVLGVILLLAGLLWALQPAPSKEQSGQVQPVVVRSIKWCGKLYTEKEWRDANGPEYYWNGKCPP